jgi:hypothetical protein
MRSQRLQGQRSVGFQSGWYVLAGLLALGWIAARAHRELERRVSELERTTETVSLAPPGTAARMFESVPESRFQDRDETHGSAAKYD